MSQDLHVMILQGNKHNHWQRRCFTIESCAKNIQRDNNITSKLGALKNKKWYFTFSLYLERKYTKPPITSVSA